MELKKGEQIAKYASIVVGLLAVAKLLVGYFFNSIALLADGIHSFADLLPISITFFALKVAQRKPNEKFPYGYYKAETIASFVVAIFILFLGIEMLYEGISSIFNFEMMGSIYLPMAVALVSALVSYFLYKYEYSVGKKINSKALMLDGKEKRIDIFASLLVFVAIVSQFYGINYVSGVVASIIAIFILHIGWEGFVDSVLVLLDAWMDEEKLEKIKKSMEIDNIKIVDLKLRKAGPYIFGDTIIEVPAQLSAAQLESIKNRIINRAKKYEPQIIDITVEPKVAERKNRVIAIPLENGKFSKKFGRAKKFAIFYVKNGNIVQKKILNNPEWKRKVRAGLHTAKFLMKHKVTDVIAYDLGEISFNTLNTNYILAWKAKGRKIENMVKKLLKLEPNRFAGPGHEV